MQLTIGQNKALIQQAQAIRYQVFTLEQDIPKELDLDGLDDDSVHILATKDGEPIATARLNVQYNGLAVIARIAVVKSERGSGVAALVIQTLLEHAKTINVQCVAIHAHNYLKKYYERFGFTFLKEVEVVGEHQLIEMQLDL